MLGSKSRSARWNPPYARRLGVAILALVAIPAVALALSALAFFAASYAAPAPYLADGTRLTASDVAPDQTLTIVTPRFAPDLTNVSLRQVERAADGTVTTERRLPVSLAVVEEGTGLDLWRKVSLRLADGASPLAYDGEYRLAFAGSTPVFSFPLPGWEATGQEFSFKTLTSPRPLVEPGVVSLRYREPVQVRWSAPIESFAVAVTPAAEARVWVDANDRRVGYVDLPAAAPGTRYEISLSEAKGANGVPLQAPASVTVETAAPPALLADSVRLDTEVGTRVALEWDGPVASFDYTISPSVSSKGEVDAADPRRTYIVLENAKQGQKYEVSITGAEGVSGAPMTDLPQPFSITTPKPIDVVKLTPRGGAFGVVRDTAISIRFSEAVRDRAAAEKAISITPAVEGRFEWPQPDQVRFVPNATLAPLTKFNVSIAAGSDAVRGESGGYFDKPYEYSFLTQPNKSISVNLTTQRVTLFEDGKAVFSAPVSTGVRFAETPTGSFLITNKWTKLRMRGTNPSGISYDIPDVPWVMQFLGDYTFHGAPWRGQFGTPLSNGCVSMETSNAKFVYDWTPLGTPVKIFY